MALADLKPQVKESLKDLVLNPVYAEILLEIQGKERLFLDELKERIPDEDKIKALVSFLEDNEFVKREGNSLRYAPSEEYQDLDVFLANFKQAKNIYYDQVRIRFKQRAFNVIILQDKLNETFDNLNKYSDISSRFRTFYQLEGLYKGSAELALDLIGVDAFEIFEVVDSEIKNVFSSYSHKDSTFSQTKEEKEALKNALNLKEPIVVNSPQPNSMREKKVFTVFPLVEENKVLDVLLFGFDNKKLSMIRDYLLELIDGFALNFRLTLKTVQMIKILENRVNERTQDLRRANSELREINTEIDIKNKAKIREIEIGANIQRAVIPNPKKIPPIGPLKIGAIWIPMPMKRKGDKKVDIKEVSGDFFNYYQVNENEVGFVIADASGHGVPAALLTMMASAAFSHNSRLGENTAEICSSSNKEVHNAIGDIGYYLTAFFLKINLKTLETEFTNAGHHKALIYRRETKKLEEWDSAGFFIGSFQDAVYDYGRDKLYPGDKILMTTDGIEEARNAKGEFYEDERLKQFLIDNADLPAKDFADALLADVVNFCDGHPADDDRTILVIDVGEPLA